MKDNTCWPGVIVYRDTRVSARIISAFVKFWSDVKVAIVLILALAGGAVLGTVVPQGSPEALSHLGLLDWQVRFLVALKAYDVYTSPLFLGLLALLFLSLAVCTWVRMWPRLRYALGRPETLAAAAFDRLPEQRRLPAVSLEAVASILRRNGYRVFESGGNLAADKHRLFRFAPMVVHLGLFMILVGAIAAGLFGFKGSVAIMPGETVSIRQAVGQYGSKGPLATVPADWQVRLDDFTTTHQPDGSVKQFYATLSVVEGGKPVRHQTIHVNAPLGYRGVSVYQAFWGIGAQRFTSGAGKSTDLRIEPRLAPYLAGFATAPIRLGDRSAVVYASGMKGPFHLFAYPGFEPLGEFHDGKLAFAGSLLEVAGVAAAPAIAGVRLEVDGRKTTFPVRPGRDLGLQGYLSAAIPLGSRAAFAHIPGPADEIGLVDAQSSEPIGPLTLGAERSIQGHRVRYLGTVNAVSATRPSQIVLQKDGKPQRLDLFDFEAARARIDGLVTRPDAEIGGRRVTMIQRLEPLNSPLWVLDSVTGRVLAILRKGDRLPVGTDVVRYDGPVHFSGLRIKADPGLPIVYLGFGIVLLGTVLGVFSHRQIFVSAAGGALRLGGKSHRNPHIFSRELDGMIRSLGHG